MKQMMRLALFLAAAAPALAGEERRKTPVYTNADLERVAPRRDETGGSATPATAPPATPARTNPAQREAYWRREAERLRDRLQPLRDRAEELKLQIDERRRKPSVRPVTDPQLQSWQRKLDALAARVREAEDRFEERARREGALPGWLR